MTTPIVKALEDKLATLKNRSSDAFAQGRSPRDVPVTLQFAVDITTMALELAQQVERLEQHVHAYQLENTGKPQ